MTSVVVIGDVHGNAPALRAAVQRVEATLPDIVVFVGDLLTYGHDVEEVLQLVHDMQVRHRATLLLGNHDQMYLSLARGERAYFDKLPDWIKESVELTLTRLDIVAFRDQLTWSDEVTFDNTLFAHAGPYASGDWTYVSSLDEHRRAASAVESRGLRGCCFGHTHRARWYVGDDASATADVPLGQPLKSITPATLVANAGAIGQPRDKRARAVLLRLALHQNSVDGLLEPLDYEVDEHLASLRAAPLRPATIERLTAFFRAQK